MAVVALKKSIDKVFLLLWAVLSLLLVWGAAVVLFYVMSLDG